MKGNRWREGGESLIGRSLALMLVTALSLALSGCVDPPRKWQLVDPTNPYTIPASWLAAMNGETRATQAVGMGSIAPAAPVAPCPPGPPAPPVAPPAPPAPVCPAK
jgi:periplasmic protein TonB